MENGRLFLKIRYGLSGFFRDDDVPTGHELRRNRPLHLAV